MDLYLSLLGDLPNPIELMLRATGLLTATAGIAWMLRRNTASSRHLLWTTAFIALVGLPLTAYILPTWSLPVVAPTYESGVESGDVSRLASFTMAASGISPASLLSILWATGSFIGWLSLGVGLARYSRMVRGGRTLSDPAWIQDLRQLTGRLRLDREVQLVMHPEVRTPMTGGWRQPVILLPEDAPSWAAERRTAILAHELIHVQRHDALRQLIGSLALALYWFHPLSWWAARRSILCREQACDEGVLLLGVKPSQYASHLLALAERRPSRFAIPAMPLIQRSQLEQRILAILQPQGTRPGVSMGRVMGAMLLLWALSTTVAMPFVPPDSHDPCPFRTTHANPQGP